VTPDGVAHVEDEPSLALRDEPVLGLLQFRFPNHELEDCRSYSTKAISSFTSLKFVVDTSVVLQLASEEVGVSAAHKLLAPTLLRSQALSALHEAVQRGELSAEVARGRLTRIRQMKVRLLGDAVLQRRAWDIADQLGWSSAYAAEYLALTQLQADAFVTLDAELARSVEGIVATASIDALR
jgi:predicted nucleic acid-binding protein